VAVVAAALLRLQPPAKEVLAEAVAHVLLNIF
jgi:hypothetical protein